MSELPGAAGQAFQDFFGSIEGAITHIGTIGAALGSHNWVGVGLGFANFLSSVESAGAAARRLAELVQSIKSQIEKANDDLFFVKNEMANIETSIAKLTLGKISAQQRVGDYRRIVSDLNASWNSADRAALTKLVRIAERAHRDIRVSVAADVYALMRYVDLRTSRNDGLSAQVPPDGVAQAFNATHMQAILRQIGSLLMNEPPSASIDFPVAEFDRETHRELFAALNEGVAMNVVVDQIPAELARARVSSISIDAEDEAGASAKGTVFAANNNVQYFPAEGVRYLVRQYNVPTKIGQFDDNARIFAYQSPMTIWTVRFLQKRVSRFSLMFRLELPVSKEHALGPSSLRAATLDWGKSDGRVDWAEIAALDTVAQ